MPSTKRRIRSSRKSRQNLTARIKFSRAFLHSQGSVADILLRPHHVRFASDGDHIGVGTDGSRINVGRHRHGPFSLDCLQTVRAAPLPIRTIFQRVHLRLPWRVKGRLGVLPTLKARALYSKTRHLVRGCALRCYPARESHCAAASVLRLFFLLPFTGCAMGRTK
jgi:hypothetical protein